MESDSADFPAVARVFVQLPESIQAAPNANADSKNWPWHHILSIPVSILNGHRFSMRPYKWMRFVTGIICGVVGHLKSSKRPEDAPCDYETSTVAFNQSFDVFYHIESSDQSARLQPVDPDINERLTNTHSSSLSSAYAPDVGERDGWRCVLTGFVEGCDAAHIIPHVKGNEYIRRLTERNGVREEGEKAVIDDIDDRRNGLYLQMHLHRRPDLAFLQTPNFAMLRSDVPGPGNVPDPDATLTSARCTVHVFTGCTVLGATPERVIVESGSPVRIAKSSDRPPPVLLDATYAALVLKTFGGQAAVAAIKNVWQAQQLSLGVPVVRTAEEDARRERRKNAHRARRARLKSSEGPDGLDLLLLIPYLGVPPERVREYRAEERAKREVEEHRRSEARVVEWRDQCADAGL